MRFEDIRPFVRYARYKVFTHADTLLKAIAYDARIFFAVSGDGAIFAGETEYKMPAGALLLLPPGMPYFVVPSATPTRYAILNFDYEYNENTKRSPIAPSDWDDFCENEKIPIPNFTDNAQTEDIIYLKNAMPLCDAMVDIVREYTRRMVYFEEKCSAQLAALLFEIYRRTGSGSTSFDTRIDEILSYIDGHFSEDISNEKIAEVFCFHKNHISAIIKQATGMPLHKYLIHTRLRHAIDMLDSGEKSVTAIAEACGFFDAAHFSRTFKSAFGCNPKNYGLR